MKTTSKAIRHRDFLTLLGKSKQGKRRKMLLEAATSDEIKAVAECALNLLKNRIKLNNNQKRRLKRHKETLRYIAHKGTNIKKKRRAMQQKGGFLTSLLPLAISAVTSLVPALLGSK